jgi:hypothetical protein
VDRVQDREDAQPAEAGGEGRERRMRGVLARAAEHPFTPRGQDFLKRYEQYTPPVFFFGGVLWDALTLRRIDAWFDNLLLFLYLLLLGGLIVMASLVDYERTRHRLLLKYRAWFPAAIQFLLGALLSAYVVFYAQSASLTETSLYLILLLALLVVNEFIHRRLIHLYVLAALYSLATVSFFTFFIPVATGQMSYATFLLAIVLTLVVVVGLLRFLWVRGVFKRAGEFASACAVVAAVLALLHLFYVKNWIPPVPLAMREGGIYHHASRPGGGGAFLLERERTPWFAVRDRWAHQVHYTENDTLFCFTAIFAPTRLTKKVYHTWRWYDAAQDAWMQSDRIGYALVGGRDGGFRGYTFKRKIHPGHWRVDVETNDGRLLGRVRFRAEPVPGPVPLEVVEY